MSQERRLSDAPRIAHVGIAVSDLAAASAFYRDVLAIQLGASVELSTADRDADLRRVARSSTPEATLRRIDAIMECRRRINANVHPQIAMEAMTAALYLG